MIKSKGATLTQILVSTHAPNFRMKWFYPKILPWSHWQSFVGDQENRPGPISFVLIVFGSSNLSVGFTGSLFSCYHPILQGFTSELSVHGCSALSSSGEHKYHTVLVEGPQVSTMLLSSSSLQELLVLPDPPWIVAPSWRSFMVTRIHVSRAIVSSILAPCQARELATVDRRILVISPESSHLRYQAILVFARAQMCGHLPLIHSAYAKKLVKQISAFLIGLLPSFLMLLPSFADVISVHVFF